ncbi:atrial natriuretic peptide receptor 1-like [Paramacrobiotus metropolitanus]|uniref:atrial natriuretic peptide receptor 1-like n=1 Tax=Paramacrobiotus metropolitanus TaxID=2943436 RepID=UPI00244600AB|nr:atrial natriuretic peptide receptor 1-like [Paramacrobiotus metropolitanus]
MPHSKFLQIVDIYSSGLIIYDILTTGNFFAKVRLLSAEEIKNLNNIAERLTFSIVPDFENILRSCLDVNTKHRPNIQDLCRALAGVSPLLDPGNRKATLIDKICIRLENYSADLERQVAIRTTELIKEMGKCDAIINQILPRLELYSADLERQVAIRTNELKEEMDKCDAIINQILPRSVAKQLRAGEKVSPDCFDCVTIMFTDLYGFADFIKAEPPEVTIDLISATETHIDKLSSEGGVFKVEAISDSFMVASGLPEIIGRRHIERIAAFAIRLLTSQPQLSFLRDLRFKIGIHSGPCAAGLMGLKRPRYCVYGLNIDTHITKNSSSRAQLDSEFRRRTKTYFNYTYPLFEKPYVLIASGYTSVFALAQVINDTLSTKAEWSGAALAQRFLNQTFSDDFGNSMYIDSEGQRRTDYTVSYINANGSREPMLQKFGGTKDLVEIAHLTTWVGAPFPPPNEPSCGYLNQRLSCITPSKWHILILQNIS